MPCLRLRRQTALVLMAAALSLPAGGAISQTPAYSPFPALGGMMGQMMPIIVQSAVEHCPTYFGIADKQRHAAGLAQARATFTNPGDYHYTTIKARADKTYRTNPKQCDRDLAEFRQMGNRDLIYKK